MQNDRFLPDEGAKAAGSAMSERNVRLSPPPLTKWHSNGHKPEADSTKAVAWPQPPDPAANYGVLGTIAREVEAYTEAESAPLLLNLLTTTGVALGCKPYLQIGAKRHRAVMDTVNVADTGENKQDGWAPIEAVLSQVPGIMAEAGAQARGDAASGGYLGTTGHFGAPVPPQLNGLTTGEGLLWAIREERSALVQDKKNHTTVRQVMDEGVPDKRLLVIEEEFARVLATMHRDGSTLSATLRKLFDSPDVERSSPKNNPVVATAPHVGLIGQITPEELRRKLHDVEFFNGFANRFAWVLGRRVRSMPCPPDYSGKARAHAVAWYAAWHRARHIEAVTLDDAATALWVETYEQLRRGEPQRVGVPADVCARAHVHVLRMALIFAVMDGLAVIGQAHIKAALALWDYCERCATYLFSDLSPDPIVNTIADVLKRGRMTRDEIAQLFHRHQPTTAIQADALADDDTFSAWGSEWSRLLLEAARDAAQGTPLLPPAGVADDSCTLHAPLTAEEAEALPGVFCVATIRRQRMCAAAGACRLPPAHSRPGRPAGRAPSRLPLRRCRHGCAQCAQPAPTQGTIRYTPGLCLTT
jgi:Protein of unknown function (DUF3987)